MSRIKCLEKIIENGETSRKLLINQLEALESMQKLLKAELEEEKLLEDGSNV